MRVYAPTLAVFLILAAIATPKAAFAQKTAYPHSSPRAGTADDPTGNPYQPKVISMAKSLAHELTDPQVQALAVIRDNFGKIRAVQLAQADVSRAAQACGNDNPDLKPDMDGRYEQWQKTLSPIILQDQQDMSQTIRSGIAGNSRKIQAYLNMVDKAASYADSMLDKRPVTTPGACHALLKSMDRTQDALINALANLHWPQEAAQAPIPAKAAQ